MDDIRKDFSSNFSIYNGSVANGFHWLEAFESYAAFSKMSEEDVKLALPLKLAFGARELLDAYIKPNPTLPWTEIKKSLGSFVWIRPPTILRYYAPRRPGRDTYYNDRPSPLW